MKKYAGKIMMFSLVCLVAVILGIIVSIPAKRAQATPTVTSSVIDDWAAVAEDATDESTVIDISANYMTAVHIQAFTDMNDAHEGTEFIIQVSGMSSGDEDWSDFTKFIALVGDGDSEPIDDDPLGTATNTITVSDTGGLYETEPMGKWIAIEDNTIANCELVWLTDFTSDTDLTIQDHTTNEHAKAATTLLWDIAMSRTIIIPFGVGYRARVICNNGYDGDGTASSLVWKVGKTVTTDMEE